MALRDTAKTAIEGDATLAGLLTGGVFAGDEISREETPGAFDANDELEPCALVKTPDEFPDGPLDMTGRGALSIYFYQRNDYDVIDQCIIPTRTLFHRQKLGDAADRVFEVRWTGNVTDQKDIATGWSLHLMNFEIWRFLGTG